MQNSAAGPASQPRPGTPAASEDRQIPVLSVRPQLHVIPNMPAILSHAATLGMYENKIHPKPSQNWPSLAQIPPKRINRRITLSVYSVSF
jgi:hypothetical protein